MKKLIKILSGILLCVGVSSAFATVTIEAANTHDPIPNDLRVKISDYIYASSEYGQTPRAQIQFTDKNNIHYLVTFAGQDLTAGEALSHAIGKNVWLLSSDQSTASQSKGIVTQFAILSAENHWYQGEQQN